MTRQTAYAVSADGVVDLNVIHGHARGAMVNFLCTNVAPWNTPAGQQRMASVPDAVITDMFCALQRTYSEIQLVVVTIQTAYGVDPATLADVTAPAPPAPNAPAPA